MYPLRSTTDAPPRQLGLDATRWQDLSLLLDLFPELDRLEQTRRLAALRERDPLLAAELESLLASASRAAAVSFLGGSVRRPCVPATLAGRRFGAYVIEAYIGEGSSASVWRARRHDGAGDETVALKLLHLSRMSPTGMQRFRREGIVLSRMRHPGIAQLIDVGIGEQGQPFLALEFVDGQQIDSYCDAHRLGIGARLQLMESVLAAVGHAHARHVVHRDIKPNNILVAADGAIKLLDFGIAKVLAADSGAELLTLEGSRVMTPEYAAPEQVNGGTIDATTDVYALGVLLSQLVTGRRPTPAACRRCASAQLPDLACDLAAAVQTAVDRRTTLAELRRQARSLRAIVERCLRAAQHERYPSVQALAVDLRGHRMRMSVYASAHAPGHPSVQPHQEIP